MTDVPVLTRAAREHLTGGAIVFRCSPRNGCCGGRALLPVAEPGPPNDPGRYERIEAAELTWYVHPPLLAVMAAWTVDAVGIGRWRRLHIDGAQPLDPAHADTRFPHA